MSSVDYDFDPSRQIISVRDPRLTRLLVREPERCATVNEYAQACGIEVAEVIDMLAPYLEAQIITLDFFADEVFVNTGPQGRPAPSGAIDVPPNLWEQLRERGPVDVAYALWSMMRLLERSGWVVEHRLTRILFGLGGVAQVPHLGVRVGTVLVPLTVASPGDQLGRSGGILDQYEWAGARALAVVCDDGALDDVSTVVRRWILTRRVPTTLSVLILERPRFNPTLLSPGDAAVTPVSLSRDNVGNYFF